MAARILRSNLIQGSGTVLTASSFETSLPLAWLRDQLLSKACRFRVGWDVVTGVFDKIDFKEAGVARVGTVAAGNYATGAAMATAVQTAMNSAPGHVNTYTVTYDGSTHKLTITRSAGASAIDLPFSTGANKLTSVHHDLGFADTDLTGSTSYVGGTAVYQSRRWIGADLGSAQAVQAGIARYHNSAAGGTYKIRASGTSVANAITGTGLPVDQTLAGDSDIRIAFFGSSSQRYWALLIDDVTNTAGYNEVGIWYAGPYDEPSFNYTVDFVDEFDELSTVDVALGGAQFIQQRTERRLFTLTWEALLDADKATFLTIKDATPKGKDFFVALNPAGAAPFEAIYGWRPGNIRFPLVGPAPGGKYWNAVMPFAEALP